MFHQILLPQKHKGVNYEPAYKKFVRSIAYHDDDTSIYESLPLLKVRCIKHHYISLNKAVSDFTNNAFKKMDKQFLLDMHRPNEYCL